MLMVNTGLGGDTSKLGRFQVDYDSDEKYVFRFSDDSCVSMTSTSPRDAYYRLKEAKKPLRL